MKSFLEFLNEIAVNNQDGVSNQAISSWINGLGGPGLNYDFNNLPPTKRKKIKKTGIYKLENYEGNVLKISDIADVQVNFPSADFWLTRKGSDKEVGKPTKNFDQEKIGIKVKSDKVDANYLFYVFMYLHSKGFFEKESFGMTNLKNIRTSTVRDIKLNLSN